MRILIILAATSLAGVAGLLLARSDDAGKGHMLQIRAPLTESDRRPDARPGPTPTPLPDIARIVAAAPRAPKTQEELAGFVALCARRGEEAVPELRALLEGGTNHTLRLRWEFTENGRLKGYPTLRAAILDALGQIPGPQSAAILRGIVAEPAVIQEACLAAHALYARDTGGWVPAALEQAGGKTSAVRLPFQFRLVELAAQADPGATASQVVAHAPRGEDGADPKVLASAFAHLPAAAATRAAWQLLGDREVTTRAKARFARALCERTQAVPEVFRQLHDIAASADWPATLRVDTANAAANAQSFLLDENEFLRAKARHDGPATTAIRKRFEERLIAVERLIHGLVGADPADPRAAAVLRTLDRHRKRLR